MASLVESTAITGAPAGVTHGAEATTPPASVDQAPRPRKTYLTAHTLTPRAHACKRRVRLADDREARAARRARQPCESRRRFQRVAPWLQRTAADAPCEAEAGATRLVGVRAGGERDEAELVESLASSSAVAVFWWSDAAAFLAHAALRAQHRERCRRDIAVV